MILEQAQKTAVSVGNIQENVVGIDAKNVSFITSLLTEKLYSNPIESFIREIVSNAYDSHIEAGSTEPVLINIAYAKSDKYEISIRDYGVGLSPERFELIYKNIGSSSKRDSNDYIGCLGIGRFAGLAVSNMCTIISYYDGTKDVYAMYKDEGTVHIDRLSSSPTKEKNGLSVSCIIDNNYTTTDAIRKGIMAMAYFPQIYVNNTTLISIPDNFNSRKIKKYNSYCYVLDEKQANSQTDISLDLKFSEISTIARYKVLYGNVLYPVCFPSGIKQGRFLPQDDSFVLRFDIGELDITPSREALQMTPKTVAAINKKLDEYDKEIKDKIRESLGKFDSFDTAFTGFTDSYWNFPLSFDKLPNNARILAYCEFECYLSFIGELPFHSPFKDKNGNQIIVPQKFVHTFLNALLLRSQSVSAESKYFYRPTDRAQTQNYTNARSTINSLIGDSFFVNRDKTFSPILRLYLRGLPIKNVYIFTRKEEHILLKELANIIKKNITQQFTFYSKNDDYFFNILFKGLYVWYLSKRRELSKSTLPQSVLDEWKALHPKKEKGEKKKVNTSEVILYYIDNWYNKLKKFDDIKTVLNWKGTVVYMDKNSAAVEELLSLFKSIGNQTHLIINQERVLFVATAKKNLDWCKQVGFIPVEEWINNETNPFFRKLAAIYLWAGKNQLNLDKIRELIHKSYKNPWCEKGRYYYLDNTVCKYIYAITNMGEALKEVVQSCVENNFVDWKLFAKLPTISELNIMRISTEQALFKEEDISLWTMALMKRKVIPFNVRTYFNCKKQVNECIESRW